ncbi:MAG: CHAD domain-containing protein, partial [Mycobacteriaceae bacterium]|nr:CHAD domain-containing protein [Mycobacteriaceae bacterium]
PAGHGSKLARVLGAAVPQRPAPPRDPVHRAVAGQIERLLEWDRGVRADADDAVHQMRVATRQIRSLLQASEDAFGLTDDAWILGELRELAAVLGVARDAEVLAARYHHALEALPPHLVRGPIRDRLVGGARRRYEAGLRRSVSAMRSERYFRLLDALDALVVAQPPAPDSAAWDSYPPRRIEEL